MTAVITGHHSFDVPGFHNLFRSLPGVDAYIQTLGDFCADAGRVRDQYRVLVFYNFHHQTPGDPGEWWEGDHKGVLEQLGKTGQGILVMHHALLAFPEWPTWSNLCALSDRSFDYHPDQTVDVHVAAPEHPITRGLPDWQMVDETYEMADADPGSDVLLTTDHPKSMRTLAWTHSFGAARVFCLALGHDAQAYGNPHFRAVVGQAIAWLAGSA
jgi:hypothetical protein